MEILESKYCCVIDKDGFYVEFVLVLTVEYTDGENRKEVREEIQYYDLKDGESLIEAEISPMTTFIKPRWNGSGWEETHIEPTDMGQGSDSLQDGQGASEAPTSVLPGSVIPTPRLWAAVRL